MLFVNRENELERLSGLVRSRRGGLAVVHGRRRIGKTRLLLEWCRRHDGLYTVSDESAADVQRRYLAREVATRFPGFADVEYPDWRAVLDRLAQEAARREWRGPIVLDELPYAVASSPELPSVLQRWIDHDAARAGLVVAIAGSSQRMMQGIVLSSSAPLFGRAREILDIPPLPIGTLREALRPSGDRETVELYAAWGGVPRYWELAAGVPGGVRAQIERLVLDPLGPLHREPDCSSWRRSLPPSRSGRCSTPWARGHTACPRSRADWGGPPRRSPAPSVASSDSDSPAGRSRSASRRGRARGASIGSTTRSSGCGSGWWHRTGDGSPRAPDRIASDCSRGHGPGWSPPPSRNSAGQRCPACDPPPTWAGGGPGCPPPAGGEARWRSGTW